MTIKEEAVNSDQPSILEDVGARPWLRYWARTVDLLLFAIVITILTLLISPELKLIEMSESFAFTVALIVFWVLFETVILTVCGTTPGKSLFSIKLTKTDNTSISFADAFIRSVRVCWRGMALGLPLISLFTMLQAYDTLSKDNVTSWDRDGAISIVHGRIGKLRLAAIVVFLILLLGSCAFDIYSWFFL